MVMLLARDGGNESEAEIVGSLNARNWPLLIGYSMHALFRVFNVSLSIALFYFPLFDT